MNDATLPSSVIQKSRVFTITDSSGGVLPGVDVTLTGITTRKGVTNERGVAAFVGLPDGAYTIRAELRGFVPLQHQLQLPNGQAQHVTLVMHVAALQETITVTGAAPTINATTAVGHFEPHHWYRDGDRHREKYTDHGENAFRAVSADPGHRRRLQCWSDRRERARAADLRNCSGGHCAAAATSGSAEIFGLASTGRGADISEARQRAAGGEASLQGARWRRERSDVGGGPQSRRADDREPGLCVGGGGGRNVVTWIAVAKNASYASAIARARQFRGDDPDGYRAEFARLMELAATLSKKQTER